MRAAHWENLRSLLWISFWLATALAAIAWPLGWGEVQLAERVREADLRGALGACLRWLDVAWIALAAANIYLLVAAQEGLGTARRWALTIFLGSAAVLALAAKTGWPFGPITYTTQLGPRLLGLVPAGLPLLWFVLVAGGRLLMRGWFPRFTTLQITLGVGTIAFFTGLCIELVAWQIRAYWLWEERVPWENYGAWFGLGALLAAVLRERSGLPVAVSKGRPLSILLALNGVFLLTGLVWRLYQ